MTTESTRPRSTRRIVVVGSANLDIVVPVPRHPVRGETVLGGDHRRIPGGKGANQAVAAARLDADVAFVGRIGADAAGESLRASLEDSGADTTSLIVDQDAPSGIALITVDPDGDNAIVVSPGANGRLSPDDIEGDAVTRAAIADADAVLLQLEVPLDTVEAVAALAGGTVVLDPAPAPDEPLPSQVLQHVDVLVPNETELAALAGLVDVPESLADVESAARSLGVETVIVTLGDRGAVIVTADDAVPVESPTVDAVDTTAAGDAFRAALAVSLVGGAALTDATAFAVRVGAATVLVSGAQPSLPTRAQVDERLTR